MSKWKRANVAVLSVVCISFVTLVYEGNDHWIPKTTELLLRPVIHVEASKKSAFVSKIAASDNKAFVFGKPMEQPANVNYTDNIYFTVKTTESNYEERLLLLMTTWLQIVKNKVGIYRVGANPL